MSQYKILVDGDTSTFFQKSDNGVETSSSTTFRFLGFFNKIHPYFQKQMDFVEKVLASKNIFLNIITVPTETDMCENIDKGYIEISDLKFKPDFKISADGNCYHLFQDEEMGRGWAVLSKKNMATSEIEIIIQDHRDNVRDWLLEGEFIRSFGIDYQIQYQ